MQKMILRFLILIFSFSSVLVNAQAPANDVCSGAINLGTLGNPGACGTGIQNGAVTTVAATNVNATPESPYNYLTGCGMAAPANSVWYKFTAPTNGYGVKVDITGATFSKPNIALYSGTTCATLSGINCVVGSGGAASLTVPSGITAGATYYLQISGDTLETGTFTLNVNSFQDCSDCLTASTLTVSPLPVNGTYQPGQTVSFCFHIDKWTQGSDNWLHGVQLAFGSGWDLTSLTTTPPAPYFSTLAFYAAGGATANCGNWAYYPAGVTSTANATSFPAGFYFNGTYSTFLGTIVGCGSAADGNPGNNFGDGRYNPGFTNTIPANAWNFCWTIKVKSGCNPGLSLVTTVGTSGDGESGNWTNVGCANDPQVTFNALTSCCPPDTSSTSTCGGTNNGTATASPIGTAGPYQYAWSPSGQTTQTATSLTPGSYTVTVTDKNLCTSKASVSVIADPKPNAGLDKAAACYLTDVATLGGTGTGTWTALASNPGTSNIVATTSPTTAVNTFSTAGTYNYVWANATGCKDTVAVVVGNSCGCANQPTVALGIKTGAICAGKTQAIAGTFGGSATQVTYSTSGSGNFGTPNAAVSPFNVTYTPSTADTTAGTVTLYVTTNNPLGSPCSVAKDSFVLTLNRKPYAAASNTGAYCAGTTIALSSLANGNSYSWSGPLGYSNATQNPSINGAIITMGGSYTVTVTNAATCTATASTTVVVNNVPAASASGGLPYCEGDTIKLVGGPTAGGNTYQWSGPNSYANGTQSPIILNSTAAMSGSYSVTVTNSANCTASANANVVVNAVPVATASNSGAYCAGATIALTGGAGVVGNSYQWSGPLAYSDGTQSPTIAGSTVAMSGTYTITVTNSSSCTATASTNVVVDAVPIATASNSGDYCAGETIVLTGGATGNTSYSWSGPNAYSNGTQSPAVASSTPAMSGTYSITVTNAGCTATASTNVVVNALPNPTASSDKVAYCVGEAISFDVNPTANSYAWSGPNGFTDATKNPTIASAALANAGLYTVTVTDVNTCTATATTTVNVNSLPVPLASNTSPVCEGSGFQLNVNTANASYSWAGPNGFSDATQNPTLSSSILAMSGVYTVSVTDGNNCSATGTTNVTIKAIPAPVNNPQIICNGQTYTTPSGNVVSSNGNYYDTLTAANGCDSIIITQLTVNIPPYTPYPDQAICEGDTAQLDANVTGAVTYSWSNSGSLTDPAIQNPSAFPLITTTYIVTVTTAQCPAFDTVEVVVNPLPQLNLATANTICTANNGTATVQVTSGTPTFNYVWNPANANSSTITGLGVNTYSVTVTDSKNCSATASNNVALTNNAVPITLDRIVNVKCNGQSNGEIDVTVGNNTFTYSYVWNPTAQSTEDAFNLSAGSYSLTATDQNGCVDSASFMVTEPTVLALNANTQTDVVCNGGSNGTATVSATGGSGNYNYIWNDAGNQTTATATGLKVGSYTVTVSDDSSCTTVTNFVITEPVAITFGTATTADVKCNGGNNGSATVTPLNWVGVYQYLWNDAASQSTNPAINLTAGSYDVTVSDNNGCTATTFVQINEPPLLQVQVSGTAITCFGANDGTATAVASGGVVATAYSYSWSNNGSTATIQTLVSNTYTVTVQDDNLCTATGSYTVVEPTAINLTLSATRTSCTTSSDGKVNAVFDGGTGTLTVDLTQNGTILQTNTSGSFTGVAAGDYTVVVSDGNNCNANQNINVPLAPFNFFNTAVDSTSCYGAEYKDGHIFVEGTTIDNAPYQYSVDGGALTYDNDFYKLGAGEHTITTKDNFGCDTTFTVIVPEPLPASVDILPDDSTLQVGSSLQLYGTLKPYAASNITSYQWSPAEGLSCIDCPNPVVTPYHRTNEYHLTITYNKGCTAESSVTVFVENNLPLYVPNAFSPNGDGNNDSYLIFGEGIKDLNLKVFNRWGELIFVSTNQQTAWDGRYKGELQPPGVYVYEVEVVYLDDKVVRKQGSLSLIR